MPTDLKGKNCGCVNTGNEGDSVFAAIFGRLENVGLNASKSWMNRLTKMPRYEASINEEQKEQGRRTSCRNRGAGERSRRSATERLPRHTLDEEEKEKTRTKEI